MRRGMIIFLVFNLILLGFILNSVFTLITLLFEDCTADAIRSYDIPAPSSELIDQRPQLIPKIIHQTWRNETIPEKWSEAQQSCVNIHPDYEYKVCKDWEPHEIGYCPPSLEANGRRLFFFFFLRTLTLYRVSQLWTDEKSREFIATEYPWFLETFDSYPYPIMRADSIRYFVLAHFGGIYVDMDDVSHIMGHCAGYMQFINKLWLGMQSPPWPSFVIQCLG